MVVRKRLQNSLLLLLGVLLNSPIHAKANDYAAVVYNHGHRLYFPVLPQSAANQNQAIYLNLTFDGVQQFDAAALRLGVNGERASVDNWRNHATWSNSQGAPVLSVRLSDASFWDHRTLWQRIAAIQAREGHLRIWVHAPATVRTATLSLAGNPPPPPRVVIDGQTPPEDVFTSNKVTYKFHADGAADHLECSLDGVAFTVCASPLTYSNVREGVHQFRVRAVAAQSAPGAVNTVWFTVVPAGVNFSAIDPATSPTSRSDIKVTFRVLNDIVGTVSAQCQIDGKGYQACTSPVSYRSLAQGDHRLDVRRLTRFFFLSWTWYPTSYFWTIQSQPQAPVVHWVSTPAAATNSASASFAFAADQSSATFQCVLDSGAAQACTSPWQVNNLSEGAHRLQVTAQANGLSSQPIAFSWVTDYTAPVITASVSPTANPSNSKVLNVSYSVNEPAAVTCQVDGVARANCASPIALTGLSEGSHQVSVQATDNVGNVGTAWSYSWTIDLTAPTLTMHLVSPASLPTNQTTAQFALSASEASSISCSLDEEAAFACGALVNLSDLAEGTHTLTAVATDSVGNVGQPASFSWMIDLTAPVVTIGAVEPSENPTAHTDIQIPFGTSETASVVCNRDHSGAAPCASPFVANGLADGDHVVEFTATDLAGNVSAVASYRWTVSSTATATLDNVSPTGSPTNSPAIQFQFSSTQSNQFVCSLDGAAASSCASPQSYANLAEGSHQFSVQALNAIGVAGPATNYQWTIDLTAPVLTVAYTPLQNPSASNMLRADFTTNEAASVTCALDGATAAVCLSPYSAANLADGAHSLVLVATDTAGNSSTKTYSWRVITNATVSLGAVSPSGSLVASNQISIAFSSTNASGFDCSLDGATAAACTSPFTATVADGAHHFAVRAWNPAGQPGTAATYDWTSDTTPPVLTLGAATPTQSPTASTTLQLAYSTNEHAAVTYALDGAAPVASAASPVSVSGVSDGKHTLVLNAKDDAGNVGTPQTFTWQVITVANVTLGAAVPAGAVVASHSLSLSFSSLNSTQFTCALDGAAPNACASPAQFTVLDGAHSIAVRALNPSGQPGPAATYSWTVDTTPPVLAVAASPAGNPTASASLSLSFTSNEPATFSCALDGAAASSCASPYAVNGLADGSHTITIDAVDAVGNHSQAAYTWSILSVATVTLGTPSPAANPSNSKSISIPFSSSNSRQFVCSLDGAAAVACTSPATYTALSDGSHSFTVQALNPASQPGPGASYSWAVDTVGPAVSLITETPSWSPTSSTTLQITFTAESGATFQCAVDGGAAVACSSPWTTPVLATGSHTLSVVALDSLGNAGAAATYGWAIDTGALTLTNMSADAATQTATTIRWNTNLPANSQVAYWVGTGAEPSNPFLTTIDPNFATTHAVALSGLTSNTVYSVQAQSLDRDGRVMKSAVITFRTQR